MNKRTKEIRIVFTKQTPNSEPVENRQSGTAMLLMGVQVDGKA